MIIPTVLSDGTLDDWDEYGWEFLRDWITVAEHTQMLPPPMERFWTGVLLGTPQETPWWADGNARRRVPQDTSQTGFRRICEPGGSC